MSLIRNGGFERGNTDFWEVISGGTLEVTTVSPLYGTYCGKFTDDGSASPKVISADYIEVRSFEIVDALIYVKSAATDYVHQLIEYYDADYSLISSELMSQQLFDGTYQALHNQFIIPAGCAYIRLGIAIEYGTSGHVYYLDGAVVEKIGVDSGLSGVVELASMISRTASGNTATSKKLMSQYTTYYADLYCYQAAGTDQTLDVDVIEINPFGYAYTIASFARVTTASEQRINLPYCQGNNMYIVYTIGGSNPHFNFGVAVIGKR